MTLKEVMEITRISKSKLYVLKDQGILPSVKLPGVSKVLFHRVDVQKFIEAGRQPTTN
jgi:excisionase family DNA binding protein